MQNLKTNKMGSTSLTVWATLFLYSLNLILCEGIFNLEHEEFEKFDSKFTRMRVVKKARQMLLSSFVLFIEG